MLIKLFCFHICRIATVTIHIASRIPKKNVPKLIFLRQKIISIAITARGKYLPIYSIYLGVVLFFPNKINGAILVPKVTVAITNIAIKV